MSIAENINKDKSFNYKNYIQKIFSFTFPSFILNVISFVYFKILKILLIGERKCLKKSCTEGKVEIILVE